LATLGPGHTVGIVGLGYVGLPLLKACASREATVIGYDVDEERVRNLLARRSPVESVSDHDLRELAERTSFTTRPDALKACDTIVICVPTPLADGAPDLTCILRAAHAIAKYALREGQLIVLESTSWPGTTRRTVGNALAYSPLAEGRDYFLGFSPERENPGDKQHRLQTIPKVVSGLCDASLSATEAFYREIVGVKTVSTASCEIAEMSKLLENTYRLVNIALINEIKAICLQAGIDVHAVIDAASTKPFGFQEFRPGPGVGGHCIPVDPVYLKAYANRLWPMDRSQTPLLNTALQEIDNEANRIGRRISDELSLHDLQQEPAIGLLGVTYKANVADVRNSPAEKILAMLERHFDAVVTYVDPHVPQWRGRYSDALTAEWVANQQAVITLVNHKAFEEGYALLAGTPFVFDACGAMRGKWFYSTSVINV
jgi:UDP-N-acetyl-D-glucosamine dehydrogenase